VQQNLLLFHEPATPAITEAWVVRKQSDMFLHPLNVIRGLEKLRKNSGNARQHANIFFIYLFAPGRRYTGKPGDFRAMPSKASSNRSRQA
jgi:hypothetical protein